MCSLRWGAALPSRSVARGSLGGAAGPTSRKHCERLQGAKGSGDTGPFGCGSCGNGCPERFPVVESGEPVAASCTKCQRPCRTPLAGVAEDVVKRVVWEGAFAGYGRWHLQVLSITKGVSGNPTAEVPRNTFDVCIKSPKVDSPRKHWLSETCARFNAQGVDDLPFYGLGVGTG